MIRPCTNWLQYTTADFFLTVNLKMVVALRLDAIPFHLTEDKITYSWKRPNEANSYLYFIAMIASNLRQKYSTINTPNHLHLCYPNQNLLH